MRALFLLATIAALASAQEFHHFSGRVVDENGRALEGAFFDHTAMPGSEYAERFTNAEGRFDLWTNAPRIVLRKPGYRSIALSPGDSNKRDFTMQAERIPFPVCSGSATSSKEASPFLSSFKFRPTKHVKLLRKGYDVDYSFERYGIEGDNQAASIFVGRADAGGIYSIVDKDIWSLVQYTERTFLLRGIDIIDARGETKDGKRWRYLGRFTQSATYRDADPATAKILDEFLDRTCLQLRP